MRAFDFWSEISRPHRVSKLRTISYSFLSSHRCKSFKGKKWTYQLGREHRGRWPDRLGSWPSRRRPEREPPDDSLQRGRVGRPDFRWAELASNRAHLQRRFHRFSPKLFPVAGMHWRDIRRRIQCCWRNRYGFRVPWWKRVLSCPFRYSMAQRWLERAWESCWSTTDSFWFDFVFDYLMLTVLVERSHRRWFRGCCCLCDTC